jgi:chemotaxis signal transduction protein
MSLSSMTEDAGAQASMLVLRVAGHTLAVRQQEIEEILPLPRLSALPGAPPILLGAFQLSRELVLVLPLAGLLGLTGPAEGTPLYHHLLLLAARPGEPRLAFLVDRVTDLVTARPEPVAAGESFNGCVDGEISIETGLVPVIAVPRLVTAYEAERLRAFAAREATRVAAFSPAGGA